MGSGLYVSSEDSADSATQQQQQQQQQQLITRLIENIPGPIFLGVRDPLLPLNGFFSISLEIKKPLKIEQKQLWKYYLGKNYFYDIDNEISKLVSQFNLNASSILATTRESILFAKAGDMSSLAQVLWDTSRAITRPKMAEFAQLITLKPNIDYLVLPKREKQLLREIAIHVAQRTKVYEEWGFGSSSTGRGLGIAALFTGPSGTGKTMAAEILACNLHLRSLRIDLSTVVSKYIGETEKNLRKVFDAAEDCGAVLCF